MVIEEVAPGLARGSILFHCWGVLCWLSIVLGDTRPHAECCIVTVAAPDVSRVSLQLDNLSVAYIFLLNGSAQLDKARFDVIDNSHNVTVLDIVYIDIRLIEVFAEAVGHRLQRIPRKGIVYASQAIVETPPQRSADLVGHRLLQRPEA